jgi:putative DNA primase/helicase
VREHRADLVWAALTLGRAWLDAGRPAGRKRLGMFENWVAVIGGILDVAGIAGFLGNLRQFYATSDFERADWQAFMGAWWGRFRSESVGVVDLFDIALASEPALDAAATTSWATYHY